MNATKKKWRVILLSFVAGIAVGIGSVYFLLLQFAESVVTRDQCLSEQQQAQTVLLCLKAIDGTTNDFTKFHRYARSILDGYVHDRDQLKRNYIQLPFIDDEATYKQAQEYLAKHP